MIAGMHQYVTKSGVSIVRTSIEAPFHTALDEILSRLDTQRGGLLASGYEFPGRYKKWAVGFVNPPLELATREDSFTLTAHNARGEMLLKLLKERLQDHPDLFLKLDSCKLGGSFKRTQQSFAEEQRSKQLSVFTVVRIILEEFYSCEDKHLGLYGPFGYDLLFQFEHANKCLKRSDNQRDLVLYLPDEFVVVDYQLQCATRIQYDFETKHGSTKDLPRTGEKIDYRGDDCTPTQSSDHEPGEYAALVQKTLAYFRRGDLFEVVPSQTFFEACETSPTQLFQTLQHVNPSPYEFVFNLGGEYLIGASPEMFVRVNARRVETCPISGTIKRGQNAVEDAEQIRQLLNSQKDEAELTMCTDVDRNDKSRVCEPGSVQVIGRRQIEMYSHLIHTVDYVEGTLRPEFDALDAFLTHTWAVTVTGAPKRAAVQFLEQHERSARRWYGGAIGCLTFDGNLDTGLILRTIRLQDSVAEVRVGATVLYDSIPEAEEQETHVKASALLHTLRLAKQAGVFKAKAGFDSSVLVSPIGLGKRILLIDHEDSFVHTLANYLRQTGATVITLRHGFSENVLDAENPDIVVLSPGPGKPSDFGVPKTVLACMHRKIPVFGVCLGLQGIVEAFGGELNVLSYPQHGKMSKVSVVVPQSKLFEGLPSGFNAGRYHSLFALPERLPKELRVTAMSDDGVIMAIEHKDLPIAAVQFHPESIMSLANETGLAIIKNVVFNFAKPLDTTISFQLEPDKVTQIS